MTAVSKTELTAEQGQQAAIEACKKAGFSRAFIDEDGDLVAWHFANDDEFNLIIRGLGNSEVMAWAVEQPDGRCSPSKITVADRKNRSYVPQSMFSSVKEACELAIKNPRY